MPEKIEKTTKKKELDEIPEGGLGDIMDVIGGFITKYTRFRLYKLFGYIPWRVAYGFWGHFVGRVIWTIAKDIRKNDIKSLQSMFPQKSYKQCREISKKAWIAMGHGFFYWMMVQIPNWSKENLDKYVTIKGLEHVEAGLKKGKGVIIASTHFGLIPTLYNALALKGIKTNIIANVRVSGAIVAIKPIPNIRCIPTGSLHGANGLRPKLKYVLKQNEVLFIFADFSQRKQMGIKFMGKLGHTPSGIPILAKETGAAVIPAICYPKTMNHTYIRFLPEVKMVDMPSKKEFLGYNMLKLNNLQTWIIRKAPELYFERVTYHVERTYLKRFKAEHLNSKELVSKIIDFFKEVVDTTYEYGRDDGVYGNILDTMRTMLIAINDSEISKKLYFGKYDVDWHRVRDNFVQILTRIYDLNLDEHVSEILKYGLQQFIVLPKV